MEIKETLDIKPKPKFKAFNETFVFCAFGLASGMIYPNKTNIRQRWVIFLIIFFVNFAELFWFVDYFVKCIKKKDFFNVLRNMSLVVIISLFFFKTFYINWKNRLFSDLLKKISSDLIKGNEMEEDYQKVYEQYIREGKFGQLCWIIIPVLFSAQFPLYAAVGTAYESLKSDVGKRYMQHDLDLKFLEDKQYETPYYEIVFAYNFLQCFILMPTFVGFDGSFCISTTHLRMKLKLMVLRLHRSFIDSKTVFELRHKVKEAIKEHQEAIQFYNDIQEVYGGWLFAVFLLSSFLISFNLYQIYLAGRIEPKYTIFALSGVVHISAPCYFASNLLYMSENLGSDIYATQWEQWGDSEVTKLIIFMIAKSQEPFILTGKGMVIFNMQLFISIMQTSYSFFTLITS